MKPAKNETQKLVPPRGRSNTPAPKKAASEKADIASLHAQKVEGLSEDASPLFHTSPHVGTHDEEPISSSTTITVRDNYQPTEDTPCLSDKYKLAILVVCVLTFASGVGLLLYFSSGNRHSNGGQ